MIIYTDGSCTNNGGKYPVGGYAIVVEETPKNFIAYCRTGITKDTSNEEITNNRMEMAAILYALRHWGNSFPPVICRTDSGYAYSTFTDWMFKWQSAGWKRPRSQSIKNLDLVKDFYNLHVVDHFSLTLEKVVGHADVLGNVLADLLATGSFEKAKEYAAAHGAILKEVNFIE